MGLGATPRRVRLASTADAPVAFAVGVERAGAGSPARSFSVTGVDPASGSRVTRGCRLPDAGQGAHPDLLAGLARASGTRLSRNRRPPEGPPALAAPPYRALLTENPSPDVPYGHGEATRA